MTSLVSWGEFQRLKSENERLRAENRLLKTENQALKVKEGRNEVALDKFKKDIVYQQRREDERLRWLMKIIDPPSGGTPNSNLNIIFPQELVDHVISQLWDNRTALKRCSLVCRSWVSPSRRHLFETVDISPFTYGLRPLSSLIGHLDNPLCTFASSVTKIYIFASGDDGHPVPYRFPRGWLSPLIPQLPSMTSVTMLYAECIGDWNTHSTWEKLLNSTTFAAQITYLILDRPSFWSFNQLMQTIHSFPSLLHLEYIPDNMDNDPDDGLEVNLSPPSPTVWLPSPHVRILEIGSSYAVDDRWIQRMWNWFLQCQTRLSVIKLGYLNAPALPNGPGISVAQIYRPFSQFLQFLGPSLEVLHIGFTDDLSISLFFDNVDITHNTGLVLKLQNSLNFNFKKKLLKTRSSLFPLILSKIPEVSVTTIKVDFDIDNSLGQPFSATEDTTNSEATWIDIDHLLTRPSLPFLTEVAFRVTNCPSGFNATQYIESKLPRCLQKQLLRISS